MFRLEFEAQEHWRLRKALEIAKRAEKKLQDVEERKIRKSHRSHKSVLLEESKTQPKPREPLSRAIGDVVHCLQRKLTRCMLKKNKTVSFTVTISRQEFLDLWGGCATVTGSASGNYMKATLKGETTQEITDKLGKALNIGTGLDNWVVRRLHGEDITKRRDCAHVHVKPDDPHRKCIVARWRHQTTSQIDISGTERSTSMEMMTVRFPRHCTPVSTRTQNNGQRTLTNVRRKKKKVRNTESKLTSMMLRFAGPTVNRLELRLAATKNDAGRWKAHPLASPNELW